MGKIIRSEILKKANSMLEDAQKEFPMPFIDYVVIKELSYDERATWGECPVCHAKHGEWCFSEVGLVLGRNIEGKPPEHGVHLGRLQNAPTKVRISGCE